MGALATGMIRLDHSHVTTLLHRYKPDTRPAVKKALVGNACLALEMHAQLEEEIFYPAMREAGIDTEQVAKNIPEHNEMRRLIARLREMQPEDPGYDRTFMELMRDVLHHVADEETILLHDAERLLSEDRLKEIGRRMAKRRAQLTKDYGVEIARNRVPSGAGKSVAVGGAVLAGAYALTRALSHRGEHRPR